jgi:hypothetical protein
LPKNVFKLFEPAPVGGAWIVKQVSLEEREKKDAFYKELKREWARLWLERFDDKFRAESVAVKDYPLILVERGSVIFASKDFKAPSFREIVEYWSLKGCVYVPDPSAGGWGKFIRTFLRNRAERRVETFNHQKRRKADLQPKKGGRGWLHVV